MSQNETPLYTALLQHAKKNPVQFHIPGHKKGKGMDADFRDFIGENALSIDLINIAPLDDLHQPKGIIKRAQDLAAEAFGADHTFFSVQGTSGVIMTMVMTVCGPRDKIIVPRNVHKSVMSAIVFSGADSSGVNNFMQELKSKIEAMQIVAADDYKEVSKQDDGQDENSDVEVVVSPKIRVAISTYYKGTSLDGALKKVEEYIDLSDDNNINVL